MHDLSLGIDIGGTFTDLVLQDSSGSRRHTHKILTTTDNPAQAVLEGAQQIFRRSGLSPRAIKRVVHATTLFTNALIERKGATAGLLTTAGFADVLEIGRERKYELYDLFLKKPLPLIPAARRVEIDERVTATGEVERELDLEEVARAAERLVADGVDAIAVAYLHGFMNTSHERETARLIRERHPDVFVTASHEVSPVIREYERFSTTVANAYVGPLAQRYLDRLSEGLAGLGIEAPLLLMSSNGGVMDVSEAREMPVQLLESGPAAGALAGAYFAAREDVELLLAFDMGGTTAKMSLIDGGEPMIAHSFEAAREKRFREGSGLPISISTVELIEIGAGGGSIANIDNMGLVRVGPNSAGASPGPACYGLGGRDPTVTDADLVASLLNPDNFLGGEMKIDPAAAEEALRPVGRAAGLEPDALAWGIHGIVNESMASAARVHTAERGYDLRRCALLATGGGGPLHAYDMAKKLGVKTVICPPSAGVGSAIGLLIAPARADRSITIGAELRALDMAELERRFQELESRAAQTISRAGGDTEAAERRRFADMRYVGQGFELTVRLPEGDFARQSADVLRRAFEQAYDAHFARTLPDARVEIINLRVTLLADVTGDRLATDVAAPDRSVSETTGRAGRNVRYPGFDAPRLTPVFAREEVPLERRLRGPAFIEERESTILVGPEASFVRRANDNIVISLD